MLKENVRKILESEASNLDFFKLWQRGTGPLVDEGQLAFSFKENLHSYWILDRDGWFRSRDRKGYGVMFRSMQRSGRKISVNVKSIFFAVKGLYLPSSEEVDEPKNYEKYSGFLFVGKKKLYEALSKYGKVPSRKNLISNFPVEENFPDYWQDVLSSYNIVEDIDRIAKGKIWIP